MLHLMSQIFQYKSAIRFAVILTSCVALSLWLSRYIPEDFFEKVITPIMIVSTTTVAIIGAVIVFRHSDGLRVRKIWGWTLLIWGLGDFTYILSLVISPTPAMNMSAYQLTTYELLIGNLLGWFLTLYPTEALRPSWMNLKIATWQVLPMILLVALDYFIPFNLQPIITLYPVALVVLLLSHIRAYRIWCEENFSTLDDIDVDWILRYLVMLTLVGFVYLYICLSHDHNRGFTQLWLMVMMLGYGTEQILFRRDPWEVLRQTENAEEEEVSAETNAETAHSAYRQTLEEWMENEKPFLNPDFKLLDLRKVLPLNRTYLSQFIHNEYGCSFYQFVNRYRIEEYQRLKTEHPEMKIGELSARCGFSSPTVFTRTFTAITGSTPSEWGKKFHSA